MNNKFIKLVCAFTLTLLSVDGSYCLAQTSTEAPHRFWFQDEHGVQGVEENSTFKLSGVFDHTYDSFNEYSLSYKGNIFTASNPEKIEWSKFLYMRFNVGGACSLVIHIVDYDTAAIVQYPDCRLRISEAPRAYIGIVYFDGGVSARYEAHPRNFAFIKFNTEEKTITYSGISPKYEILQGKVPYTEIPGSTLTEFEISGTLYNVIFSAHYMGTYGPWLETFIFRKNGEIDNPSNSTNRNLAKYLGDGYGGDLSYQFRNFSTDQILRQYIENSHSPAGNR